MKRVNLTLQSLGWLHLSVKCTSGQSVEIAARECMEKAVKGPELYAFHGNFRVQAVH